MVEKVNGVAYPAQALTGSLNYFTVRTVLDIRPSDVRDPKDEAQNRLNKLVEVISTRAQPVIQGDIIETTETAPIEELPSTSAESGDISVYTFKFAIEHDLAWASAEALAESLNGVAGFVYTTPTTNNNVVVTMNEQLV